MTPSSMSAPGPAHRYTAFVTDRRLANGALTDVAKAVKTAFDAGEPHPIIVFNDSNGQVIDLDLRGNIDDVLARLPDTDATAATTTATASPTRGRGRPRLGVVSREVTLLPRHWQWLSEQPGGASVTLRKLVDRARRDNSGDHERRQRRDAVYRVISALAGNAPAFEEATRALFADDDATFSNIVQMWPPDIRDYALAMARDAFSKTE